MTGEVRVERWDVFARAPGGGNPCYLVRGEVSSELAQAVARRYGGETALVSSGGAGDRDGAGIGLRFFSPAGEMAMCVHASIAAVSALLADGALGGHQVNARTPSGDCLISWDDARPPLVSVEQPAPPLGPPLDLAAEAARSLGVPPERVGSGIRMASVSRAKLLVPLSDAAAVHAAQPDQELLGALCRRLEATGCYVFAPHPDGQAGHLVARQFPVDAGLAEDAATGVAAGALAAYIAQHGGSDRSQADVSAASPLRIDQGDAMGRPSRLVARAVTADGEVRSTRVAGSARFILREAVSSAALTATGAVPDARE